MAQLIKYDFKRPTIQKSISDELRLLEERNHRFHDIAAWGLLYTVVLFAFGFLGVLIYLKPTTHC